MGLSPDQVDSLRQLVGHPTYKTYSKLLESVGETLLRELTTGLPHEQYLAKCGEYVMLERLIELPHVILDKVAKLEDHKNARQQSIADAEFQRSRTFISTPFWEPYTRSK